MSEPTIPHHVLASARRQPNAPCWHQHDGQAWRTTSWAEAAAQVRRFGRALLALGIGPGERVAILGGNRRAWALADLGAMAMGGVPAGIYETSSAEEIAWIVDHAEARVLFVGSEELARKAALALPAMPRLEHLVMFEGQPAPSALDPRVRVWSWEDFLDRAEATPEARLDERLAALRPEDPATFIYTSGTTGPPKAVMLCHRNLAWTAERCVEMAGLGPADAAVSYLPLCHIAEQIFTLLAPAVAGSQVWFNRSREQLPADLLAARPTVFLGVPRVWEKMHAALSARLAGARGVKARLVRWAMVQAREANALALRGERPGIGLRLRHALARRLVLDRVRGALGLDRARFCVTGAAPIAPEVLEFFLGLDLCVHEVYGQSEGSGPTSFNRPGATRIGTVGQAFPGVRVRLGEDGEILVAGPNVFLGYFKDPEATAEALQEGWLRSGDLGSLDDQGFLRITGRKKEILITAGGKNIAPVPIEQMLQALPGVQQAVLIGDRRRFLSALLTLESPAGPGATSAEAKPDPETMEALQRGIDAVNARLARVEQVRRFTVLPRELSVEGGELTPTMKLKRRVIEEKYADLIEAMYA